jgi:hypothetical protein
MPTVSFDHEGATITVQRPNGFSRQRKWQLSRFAIGIEDAQVQAFAVEIAYHLANTVKVKGDLGFEVPYTDTTPAAFEAFARALGEADESLLIKWDNAIYEARVATNDPDLLPPDDVDPKGKAPKKS